LAAIYAKNLEKNIGRPLRKNTLLSVLYNFRIQISVGFYSNFWSFSRSNKGTSTQFRARARRTALGVRAAAPPEVARRPRPRLPQDAPRPATP
jgi:hypothetical protein